MVADARAGSVSPDGRYIAFIAPKHKVGPTFESIRGSLAVLDSRTKRVFSSRSLLALKSPPLWSSSMNYLAGTTSDGKLVIARLGSDGLEVRGTKIAVQELSWSADGKYLATWESMTAPPTLNVIRFRSGAVAASNPKVSRP